MNHSLRLLTLFFVCAISHAADQTGAESTKKPVSASIKTSRAVEAGDEPIGNVQVTYEDGTTDLWTTKNNCGQAHVSPNGTVGWVIYEPETQVAASYKMRPCRTLVLCHRGKIVARLQSPQPFIQEWQFQDGGSRVAASAMFTHGKTFYTLYDTATGHIHAAATSTDDTIPPWAKPLHHEN
jgi:hypothetical protein